MPASWKHKLVTVMRRWITWSDRRLPPGVRSVLGVFFIAGGLVGFLPILGFWMIPVGAALIALDVPPWRRRLKSWVARQRQAARDARNGGMDR